MKKLTVINLLFLMLIFGCGTQKNTLKIGVLLTLSGSYSEVGVSEMYAIQLAVDEINSSGGIKNRQIELVIKDDEGNKETALSRLVDLEKLGINIVIGPSISLTIQGIYDYANAKNILLLSPSVGTTSMSNKDDLFIRNVNSTDVEGIKISEAILSTNPNHILMIYNTDNLSVTQPHYESFLSTMQSHQIHESMYSIKSFITANQADVTYIENYLLNNNCDTLYIAGSNVDSAQFVNFIQSRNLNIKVFLSSWSSTGIIDRIDTTKTSNIFGFSSFSKPSNSDMFDTFESTFSQRYGRRVDMVTSNAYDWIFLIKQAVETGNSFKPEDVKANLLSIPMFLGIASIYQFNEFGDVNRSIYRMVIDDNQWITLDEW